jgi:hypothetical protein
MPTIYLRPASQEQFLQSGGIGSPPSLQLQTGNATPANINLYPVTLGTPSTITNNNSTELRLYPVIDDTPPSPASVLISVLICLQSGSIPSITQSGSPAIPPTLQLRVGEASPSDVKLQSVNGGIPSTLALSQSVDIKLYPVGLNAPITASGVISEQLSIIDSPDAICLLLSANSEARTAGESPDAAIQTNASISEVVSASDLQDGTILTPATIVESGSASDSPDCLKIQSASITESISATDYPSDTFIGVSSISESNTLIDNPSVVAIFTSSISESISIIDNPDSVSILTPSVSEALSAIDNPSCTYVATKSITETGSVSEISNGARFIPVSISEGVSASEISLVVDLVNIIEVIHVIDLISAVIITNASLNESTHAGDDKMKRWDGTQWKSIDTLVVFK